MEFNKTITVRIAGNGKPQIEASGFIGGACKEATKPILDALGASASTSDTIDKPELHQFGDESEDQFLTN